MNILQYIKSLMPRIEKTSVLEDIRITKTVLTTNVLPSYQDAVKHFKVVKISSQAVKDLSQIFYRNYNATKAASGINLISEITNKLPNINENFIFVEKSVEEIFEVDIIKEGLTAKKALLLRAVSDISFLANLAIDVLDYVYIKEINSLGNTDEVNKLLNTYEENVINNIGNFARLVSAYGEEPKKFADKVNKTIDIVINDTNYSAINSAFNKDSLDAVDPKLISGFNYSPIYFVRMQIAEWQSNRYKASQDKKRMLELRLLNLQTYNENNPDPKIEKEIEYLRNRIETIEYRMKKMEP